MLSSKYCAIHNIHIHCVPKKRDHVFDDKLKYIELSV